jgi:hypothetical protein
MTAADTSEWVRGLRGLVRGVPLAFPLVCAACVGEIGAGAPGEGSTEGPAACKADAAPPNTRVRRLTKVEIVNAAGELLGRDASDSFANLDADSQPAGGYSNSDELVVSNSFANSLHVAAELIGQEFKATVTEANHGASCFSSDAGGLACAKDFIRTFGRKAYRRPVTQADLTGLVAVYEAGREVGEDDAGDRFATGLSWVVRAVFQSPDFLYLTELGDPAAARGQTTDLLPEEVASAISFSVLGVPPDDALTEAADRGELATPDEREAHVRRLIAAQPEGWKQQMRLFVQQWLGINFSKPEWEKSADALPLFSADLKGALETETALFIDDWAASREPLFGRLLTARSTFVNEVNGPLYGVASSGSEFRKVSLDPSQRAGLLTLGGFLGSTSHVAETSPVIRGKVIMQKFLCRNPPPPPPKVPPLPPLDEEEPTTTRARFDKHLSDKACSGCHALFEPMGNAFESYDALGGFRRKQNGHPIDSSGALVGTSEGDQAVKNAVELVELLAESEDVAACITRQTFRFTMGRAEGDYDACTIARIAEKPPGDLDVRELIISIVRSDSFVVRTVTQ